ncbi:MAG: AAA family ATPase [Planctomycetaceae bacterium]|nr:AAA family ATPase [Planctomycetaceae bacterium]
MIRLEVLRLQNFRCFEDCTIEFRPDLTVLVARNGQGKTALLDAVALSLGLFVDTIAGTSQWKGFRRRDVRRLLNGEQAMTHAPFVQFEATAQIEDHRLSWRRWMRGDSDRARSSTKDARPLTGIAQQLHERLGTTAENQAANITIPLISLYGTGRRWELYGTHARRPSITPQNERCIGYEDCLAGSASFGLFADWYESMFLATVGSPVTGVQKANRPEHLLAAVNHAVESVLEPETGWGGLHWDNTERQLMLTHPVHGRLPLGYLSDGVRNTVALVADVAHRCARLNPHLGENAAQMTPGILLVDEVDLHLHPEWQQSIIRMLRAAFREIQLVVSTHSPQVLSTVDVSAIRVVRFHNGSVQVSAPQFQTKGVESADVLATIMGVDPVPKVPEAKWLSDYRAMVERGQHASVEGEQLRELLISHFGTHHPLILDCDRLIRFTQFKKKRETEGAADAQA